MRACVHACVCVCYQASCYVPGLYVENKVLLRFLLSSVQPSHTFAGVINSDENSPELVRYVHLPLQQPTFTYLMALTATATYKTRNKIIKALEMDDCKVIAMIPNNLNIYYAVLPLPPSPMCVLSALIEVICSKGREANRTIVFCRSYDNLIELYTTTVLEIGKKGKFYIEGSDPSDCRVCDKYDACTSLEVRQNIIRSFTNPNSNLRLIFATVSFSMGLDSPNVRRIIHWSAPNDLEMYVQESGRDGEDTVAILYCSDKDKNVNEDMKLYCRNTSTCRRLMLMTAFGISSEIKQPSIPHKCCDICSRTCSCYECTSVLLSFKSCTPDDLICDDDIPILTKPSSLYQSRSVIDSKRL